MDDTQQLNKEKIKQVQNIVGTLLYYSCAIEPTMATVLLTIAYQKANVTKSTQQ